jgi:Flp pilus assembly protein TadG
MPAPLSGFRGIDPIVARDGIPRPIGNRPWSRQWFHSRTIVSKLLQSAKGAPRTTSRPGNSFSPHSVWSVFPGSKAFASPRGSAMIEAAVIMPLLLILILNVLNFALFIYAWVTVNNAARAAGQYKVYNGVVVASNGEAPTTAQVASNVVAGDTASLPNSTPPSCAGSTAGGVCVEICSVFKGTVSPSTCSFSTVDDPEHAQSKPYKAWNINVSYTYVPFINALTALNSSRTISQRVVLRSMQ